MSAKVIACVLGNAQDAGVPQIGCHCGNCRDARDKQRYLYPSSLGLISPKTGKAYIIDATPAVPMQLSLVNDMASAYGVATMKIGAILLTHAHIGHYAGLMYLGKEALNANKQTIVCTNAMKQFLENNSPWQELSKNKNISFQPVQTDCFYPLEEGLSFKAIKVPHRDENADTVGYVVRGENKSCLYIPDIDSWSEFSETLNALLREVDYAFLDGTFYSYEELSSKRSRTFAEVPHPPITTTMQLFKEGILRKSGAGVYFTHFNHTNPVLAQEPPSKGDTAKGDTIKEVIIREGFKLAEQGTVLYI